MKKVIANIIIFCSFFLIFENKVNAGTCNIYINGNNTVYLGQNITLTVGVNNISGSEGIVGVSGKFSLSNSNLSITGKNNLAPFEITFSQSGFAGLSLSATPIKSSSNLFSVTFKAEQLGTSVFSVTNGVYSEVGDNKASCNNPTKTITVVEPLSSNANLKSLSVSRGTLSPAFNPSTTSYNVSVGDSVSSIVINADKQDGGASISGTGTKNLNYGNNTFSIVVTAPSGTKKTYTINVNRKDVRSNDASLKSLSASGGSLSPAFNSSTTSYEMEVPFSISKLDLSFLKNNDKSSVKIIGNDNLIAEENNVVKVIVTAENGTTKEYIINVKRGKDPDKILSKNNYMKSLSIDVGILSPAFDKEKTYYEVWLPFEIEQINFTAEVEDAKYGVLNHEGPDKLAVGINKYIYKVAAEDGSIKEYTITVNRATDPSQKKSANILLKSLVLSNGKLLKKFEKNINNYKYSGKYDKIKVTAVPEDENSNIKVVFNEKNIYIIVTSVNGDIGVYHLERASLNIPLVVGASISSLGLLYVIYRVSKKHFSKVKKEKVIKEK